MITTKGIAAAILAQACLAVHDLIDAKLEEVSPNMGAAYEGAAVIKGDKVVNVYLCDDDPATPIWMVDSMNYNLGDVNPLPLDGKSLSEAIEWLNKP